MTLLEIALEQMRQGGTFTQGSSRSHVEYGCDAHGFYVEHFDEGAVARLRTTEARVRALFAEDPALFAGLLRRHGWREVRAALNANNLPAACDALRWVRRTCDLHDNAAVWLAALGEGPPDEAVAEIVRQKARGHVLWHCIMAGLEWRRTSATGIEGAWLLDRLVQRVSGVCGQAELRARFEALRIYRADADPPGQGDPT